MEVTMRKRYAFIDWLKVISMLLIVWDHLIAVRYPDMWIVQNVKEWINDPLTIIQEFGALGVSIFLIVSGFLSAHYLDKKTTFKTFCNFWLKIYLSTVIAGVFFLLFNKVAELIWGPTWFSQYSAIQWLKSIFLLDTIITSSAQVNGTLWFMATLLFYRGVVLLISINKYRHPWCPIAILEAILTINTIIYKVHGPINQLYFLQARIPYVYIIVIGVLIKKFCDGKFSACQAFVWQIVNAILLLVAFKIFDIEKGYLASTAYACLIFIGFKSIDAKIKEIGIITSISKAGFSVYLLHGTVGALLQSLFVDRFITTNRNIAVISALAIMFVICFAYYYVVEEKYNRLFKRLLKC